MKKIILAVLLMMLVVSASFAQGNYLNVFAGVDLGSTMDFDEDFGNVKKNPDTGFSIGVEYLGKLGNPCALGLGIQYLPTRKIKDLDVMSYMPVYMTFKLTPIPSDRGIYFKFDLGYNVLLNTGEYFKNEDISQSGGLYYGIGTGYDFKFGLFVGAMYCYHGASVDYPNTRHNKTIDITYSAFRINAGYRFSF